MRCVPILMGADKKTLSLKYRILEVDSVKSNVSNERKTTSLAND